MTKRPPKQAPDVPNIPYCTLKLPATTTMSNLCSWKRACKVHHKNRPSHVGATVLWKVYRDYKQDALNIAILLNAY